MIDPKLLPPVLAFDTGVMIRALRQRADHDADLCEELFRAAVKASKTIIFPAVALAEVLRTDAGAVPRIPGITVAAFDERAARLLGAKMPMSALKAADRTLPYLKFDALVVATAARWGAKMIVSLDVDAHPLAKRVQLPCVTPREFIPRQRPLI